MFRGRAALTDPAPIARSAGKAHGKATPRPVMTYVLDETGRGTIHTRFGRLEVREKRAPFPPDTASNLYGCRQLHARTKEKRSPLEIRRTETSPRSWAHGHSTPGVATERKHQTRHGHVASMINSMKHSPLAFGRTRWHRSIVSSDELPVHSRRPPLRGPNCTQPGSIFARTSSAPRKPSSMQHAPLAPSVSVACPLNSSADDDPGIQVVGIGGDHVNDRIRL